MKELPEVESKPVPDPTELTTQMLRREIENLKELMEAKIGFTNTLKEEKFKELHLRLELIEAHRIEAKADLHREVVRAFTNQKELFDQARECNDEAAQKSELNFTKQLDALTLLLETKTSALDEKITAQKERVDVGRGGKEQMTESRGQSNWMIGVVIAAVAVIVALASIFIHAGP